MAGRPAVVFGGAPLGLGARLARRLQALQDPIVIAADSGAETALLFGLRPTLLVGDFDSIDADVLSGFRGSDTGIDEYSPDKDDTDGELAIGRALAQSPSELLLVGFLGGPRLDHELAQIGMLERLPSGTVLLDARNECQLVRSGESRAWEPEAGELVSLIPIGANALGVTTQGLRWQLTDATLLLGRTRGLGNEPIASEVRVKLGRGALLMVRHFLPE